MRGFGFGEQAEINVSTFHDRHTGEKQISNHKQMSGKLSGRKNIMDTGYTQNMQNDSSSYMLTKCFILTM